MTNFKIMQFKTTLLCKIEGVLITHWGLVVVDEVLVITLMYSTHATFSAHAHCHVRAAILQNFI